jgi:hypothetical protein
MEPSSVGTPCVLVLFTENSSSVESLTAPSDASSDVPSLPKSRVIRENFDALTLRGLATGRLKRHLGTLANATPHRRTR